LASSLSDSAPRGGKVFAMRDDRPG